MSAKRINLLRKQLAKANVDSAIISHLDHVRYLTGFTGSAGMLIINSGGARFLTDFRYVDQANKQVKGARVQITDGDPIASLHKIPRLNVKNSRVGYNGEYLTVATKDRIQKTLDRTILVGIDDVFTELGWVKDSFELDSIKKAVAISDTAFERILGLVQPGIKENEIAAELEYQMAMLGSEKPAFESIIASGFRSAMPHGLASSKKIKKGEFVTFDFGATVNGYVSDITRTVVVGRATSRQKKIYNIVLRAQKAGIRRVRAGAKGIDVDAACRNLITRAGFGKNFGHGTGHGIGFYVHVGPRLSPRSEDRLAVNNVVTIEPGIYISGWGGVRIEDDVVVTRTGSKVLNKAPKNLLEL